MINVEPFNLGQRHRDDKQNRHYRFYPVEDLKNIEDIAEAKSHEEQTENDADHIFYWVEGL